MSLDGSVSEVHSEEAIIGVIIAILSKRVINNS